MTKKKPSTHGPGTLYIVATPIGNLEDITLRACRTLKEVDLIACEDTRHSRKLLNHLELNTPLTSYYRENERDKSRTLLDKLQAGANIALISDAGTPAISDPGAVLIQQARQAAIPVVPIPGASALTTGLSAAGIEQTGFLFAGFPPSQRSARLRFFQALIGLAHSLVFYESPHRISRCLQDAITVFGDRPAIIFRELTKRHESSLSGCLSELQAQFAKQAKGEFMLIIHGNTTTPEHDPTDIEQTLCWYRDQGELSLKEAVQRITHDLGIGRSKIYKKALEIWQETAK